jgi:hypothetical protein
MELNIEGGEQSVSTYAVEPINCLKRGDTVLSLSEVFHSTSHDETDCLETVVVGEVPSSSASIVLKKLTAELPLASFAVRAKTIIHRCILYNLHLDSLSA